MPQLLVDISQVAGVAIAVFSAVLSFYFSRQSKEATIKQLDIDINNFQLEYFRDLRSWADEVVEIMSESEYFCDFNLAEWSNDEILKRQSYLRQRLSALADRGRWFLPNVQEDKAGVEKETAYRGFRQRPLGCILRVHKLVAKIKSVNSQSNSNIREDIFNERRVFVSEIQLILDPRTREQELRKFLSNK